MTKRLLAQAIEPKTGDVVRIETAIAFYAVFYKRRPVSMHIFREGQHVPIKHRSMVYYQLGRAKRRAKALNRLFGCEDFTVMLMKEGLEVPLYETRL